MKVKDEHNRTVRFVIKNIGELQIINNVFKTLCTPYDMMTY